MKCLPLLLLLLLIASCAQEEKTAAAPKKNPLDEADAAVKREYKSATVKLTQNGKLYDVSIRYQPSEFKYNNEQADKTQFANIHFQKLTKLSNGKHAFGTFDITAVTDTKKLVANPSGQMHIISESNDTFSREAAHLRISMDEFKQLRDTYADPQFKLLEKAEFYPWFRIELKLRSSKTGITNLIVGEDSRPLENRTLVEIFYQPRGSDRFGQTPKEKIEFENDFADIIRYAFESAPNITDITIVAQSYAIDTRSEPTSTIASFAINRSRFEKIMSNWDDFRFNIYKEINYTPVFLADLLSTSKIEGMRYNDTVDINASFASPAVATSISTMQEDAVQLIYGLLENDPKVKKVSIRFKGQVPVKEIPAYISKEKRELTSDGVHQIVPLFMAVSTTREVAMSLNTEKLTATQILYNMNANWDTVPMVMYLKSGLGVQDKHFRDVSITGGRMYATLDSCAFTDKSGKAKKDTVISRLRSMANSSIYVVHPPYITGASIKVDKVQLDQTGNERITSLGEMTFDKDSLTNYWFQTSESPKWITQTKNTISINDNLTICQIA